MAICSLRLITEKSVDFGGRWPNSATLLTFTANILGPFRKAPKATAPKAMDKLLYVSSLLNLSLDREFFEVKIKALADFISANAKMLLEFIPNTAMFAALMTIQKFSYFRSGLV